MIQDEIQNSAVDAWEAADYVGTLNLGVGAGKTFCFFKSLYKLQDAGLLTSEDLVVFKAERSNRWQNTVVPEADKFESIFGKNPVKDFKIKFYTYQALVDTSHAKFTCMDEIHSSLSSIYRINLEWAQSGYILGLTGTPDEQMYIFPDQAVPKLYMSADQIASKTVTTQATKGSLYQMFCPIVYTKTEEELIELEVLSPFETVIIYHKLDNVQKNYSITANWKVTEQEFWEKRKSYANKLFAQAFSISDSNDKTRKGLIYQATNIIRSQLSKFLYNLKSKVDVAKKIIELDDKPAILFGVEKESLWNLTENVIDSDKDVTELVGKFERGETNILATSKKLQQGITVKRVNTAMLFSFQSSSGQLIQMFGRIIRKVPGKMGRLYIIVTRDTYEEKWLVEMQKVKDSKGRKTRKVNLNVIAEIESDCITKESLKL
jgi:superfamily II DNA or RNA helicase